MNLDERTSGQLEASIQRARLLLGGGHSGQLESAGSSGGVRQGLPDEHDQREIAAKIRAAGGEAAVTLANGADAADALAADIVRRARELLLAMSKGAGAGVVTDADAVAFEAVLQVRGRPALKLEPRLEPIDDAKHPGSGFWRPFISDPQEQQLLAVAAATGAVIVRDQAGHAPWVQGTAWLIAPHLVITNRHVLFPPPNGTTIANRKSSDPLTARIRTDFQVTLDFARDSGPQRNMVYTIDEIPFVSRPEDPLDVAVIRVAPTATLAADEPVPLTLWSGAFTGEYVYVVGHPGAVAQVPEAVMAVFGSPDERKRVSFGKVMKGSVTSAAELLHDASTIGGYSGGCVLAFGSPKVTALHYYGHPLEGNRAFTAETLRSHAVASFL